MIFGQRAESTKLDRGGRIKLKRRTPLASATGEPVRPFVKPSLLGFCRAERSFSFLNSFDRGLISSRNTWTRRCFLSSVGYGILW